LKELEKNERDCKETLRRYSFRKPRRAASPTKQIDSISISNSEEEKQKDDLQQDQKAPLYIKRSLTKSRFFK
jgi:hypothetical protein